jgi:4-hydroxy-tetrahydrodipicolinate reductase
MRIAIHGAGGRVGAQLVELILARPGLELAAALVSPTSVLLGKTVAGSSVAYERSDASIDAGRIDVIIDFSTPAANLALQEKLGETCIPVVVGTTGFSDQDDRRLTGHAVHRPLLVSANFARGFEVFRSAAGSMARHVPGGEVSVSETYHARKKNEPSGTSRLLAGLIQQEMSRTAGRVTVDVPITVHRQGDVVGINEVRFDMGSAEILVRYQVHALAAYAEGAVMGAEWLVSRSVSSGRFSLADTLQSDELRSK